MVTGCRQGGRAPPMRPSALWLPAQEPGDSHSACQGPQCSRVWDWADAGVGGRGQSPLRTGSDMALCVLRWYVLGCGWIDLLRASWLCAELLSGIRQVTSCPSIGLFPGRHCQWGLFGAVSDSGARLTMALCFEGHCVCCWWDICHNRAALASGAPFLELGFPPGRTPQAVSAWLCCICCPILLHPCPERGLLRCSSS